MTHCIISVAFSPYLPSGTIAFGRLSHIMKSKKHRNSARRYFRVR